MANFFDQFDATADAPATEQPRITVRPEPRGVRNNNPLNIEAGSFSQSQPGFQGSDGRFAKFANPEDGFAAADHLLGVYADKHGIDTVSGIINRWAPANDGNPVSAYASAVAGDLGVDPGTKIDLKNPQVRSAVADAMAKFENGKAVARPNTDVSSQSRQSPAQPGAKNFFDQFDQSPMEAPTPPPVDGNPARVTVRPVGAAEAIGRGAAQGASLNFHDELRGLIEAGGASPDDPASVYKLIGGAIKYWGGNKDAEKTYDATVARERAADKQAEEQRPYSSLAGNVAGAVALPVGAALGAATLPGRIGRGVAVGAATGAGYGAGEGVDTTDRVSRGLTGAALGGAVGGAVPAVVEGVIRGARFAAQPAATALRGIRDPQGEAARRVAGALNRDMQADPGAVSRLTPQEFSGSVQSGGPANIMDMGGETTRALARSAANTSPEGRATLGRAIDDRFEGQGPRVTDWLRNTFHYPDADAQSHALDQVARNVNRPAYAQAMQDGSRGVWDGELQRLAGAPAIQEAARGAAPGLANRGITEGFQAPRRNPIVVNPKTGLVSLRKTDKGNEIVPDLRFWDQVKRNLDSKIGVAQRAGDGPKVGELTGLKKSLVQHLDEIVPSYQQARAGAAHFFGAQDALEAGQNFVGRNMSSNEARRALAQMSPTERQLFQDGFVSKFIDTINQTGDRRSVLNKIAESPAAREKLTIALGRQRSEQLEAGLRVEGIMDLARGAVQGNSTTARQLAELGLAGGTYGIGTGGNITNPNPSAIMNAALVYGAARGKGRIDSNVARHVAELLVSNNPRQLLRGIQIVTRSQQMFNSLRSFDRRLARIGGEQAPTGALLQAPGIGRADQQPDVPRPPGQ